MEKEDNSEKIYLIFNKEKKDICKVLEKAFKDYLKEKNMNKTWKIRLKTLKCFYKWLLETKGVWKKCFLVIKIL